jgi:hypothetical protein
MAIESATVDHEGMRFEVSSNHLTQEQLRGEPATPVEPAPPTEPAPAVPATPAADASEPEPELTPEERAASDAGKNLQKKKQSYQERINELTAARYRTEGELNAARAEVERLQGLLAPAKSEPATTPAPAEAPQKPRLEDFANEVDPYAAWNEALTDWKVDRRIEELDAKRQKSDQERQEQQQLEAERNSAQAQYRRVVEAYQGRVAEFVKEHPDYQAVLDAAPLVPDGPGKIPIFQYIENVAMGPAVAYHLAQHPDELVRIAALAPALAIAALGKIEGKLEAQQSASEPQTLAATVTGPAAPAPVSKAKPPLKPVGSSPVAVSDDDEPSPDAPFAVHKKYWDEKDRKAGLRV